MAWENEKAERIGDGSRMDRREFVGMLSAGGVVLAAGGANPFEWLAKIFGGGKTDMGLPLEWEQKLGRPLRGYSAFIGGLQLKRVSVKQVIEPHLKVRGDVMCGLPPTKMWKRMRPTLLVVDEIANRLGENLGTVISAYRSPHYNARCPGAAKFSQHMQNHAMDLRFGSPPRDVARVAREVREAGKFRGGVGLYSSFVHVDTRGTNADW